jgi:hypothetical protein
MTCLLYWLTSFRGEDLNVIFYQNMPNLHNRYKSAERKISQRNPEYTFHILPIATKLWWNGLSKIVSSDPDFQPRWPPSKK